VVRDRKGEEVAMKAARIAALGAVLVLSTAAIAQPPADRRADRPRAGEARGNRDGRDGRDGRIAGTRGGHVGRALLRDVQLTDAQRTQLRSINRKFAEQRQALVTEVRGTRGTAGAAERRARPDSATRAQLHARMQTLVERHRTEVRAILTPEQQRTFDANVSRVRDRAEAQRGKGAARGRR
jgi:Spy/CpxP family protein refolding chaperone